jgi:iron complex transport system substrate-binding protein
MRPNNTVARVIAAVAALALLSGLAACGSAVGYASGVETYLFTDSAGRGVTLPRDVTMVAPSGAVATMILATICPEYMVCVSSTPSSSQYKYLPPNLTALPTTGQLYGSRSTINHESLVKAAPQVIVDLGDRKDNIGADMDLLQKTTGIATIYLEADLAHIAEAYRRMGELFGLQDKAEAIASFIDRTMAMAAENAARIPEAERKTVMYATGASGLNAHALGSVQAQVIEAVGGINAVVVDDMTNQGGGTLLSLEQIYNFDPDVLLFAGGSIYGVVADMESWSGLAAVRSGACYEVPHQPYNWISSPPSVNMVIGVWWLGNLLYPDVFDYDMVGVAQDFYKLFWGYELVAEEAEALLGNSTLAAQRGVQ